MLYDLSRVSTPRAICPTDLQRVAWPMKLRVKGADDWRYFYLTIGIDQIDMRQYLMTDQRMFISTTTAPSD